MKRRATVIELAVATGLVVLAGSLTMVGFSRATSGSPEARGLIATSPAPVVAPAAAPALALAVEIGTKLGLPAPASRTVERITDAASGLVLDEVTDLNAAGTPLGISRFDTAGGLVSAIRLGFVTQGGTTIAASVAGTAAAAMLAKVGMVAQGSPAISSRAAGGWIVRWSRTVGAVPVPGDGVVAQLDPDGSFHALARTEHGLAPVPASNLGAAAARLLAGSRLDGWLASGVREEATIASVGLAWVVPNDTFGDPIPAGSTNLLHLAWIVRVTTTGSLADTLGGLELAFDAGTGAPLGGDLLE
jgi:hypothetical protein